MKNNEQLAWGLLNELKYNKRLLYLWGSITKDNSEEENVFDFLLNRINELYEITNFEKFSKINNQSVSLFKKIKETNKKGIKSISLSNNKKIEGKIEYNEFLKTDLDGLIISLIWLNEVGYILDTDLKKYSYANRLSEKSNCLFKPYFSCYNDFRDEAFSKMKYLVENSESGFTVQLDLTKCFYSIDTGRLKNIVDRKISKLVSIKEEKYLLGLNHFIFETFINKNELPIGFFPSNVLINTYLSELDKMFVEQFNPLSYARYVDDISIVIKKDFDIEDEKEEIEKIVKQIDSVIEEFNSNNKEAKLKLQKDKYLFFTISKGNDINFVNKIMSSTAHLSSDFYRLVDVSEISQSFIDSYDISSQPFKLSDIMLLNKEKKNISKIISSVYNLTMNKITNDYFNIELIEELLSNFFEFVDDSLFIELYDYWLQLIHLEKLLIYGNREIKIEEFNNLKLIKRINEVKNYYKIGDFVDIYIKLFSNIFVNRDNLLLKGLFKNFYLPKFRNKDLEYFYLNYEDQLNFLSNSLTSNIEFNEIDSLFNQFNNKKSKNYLNQDGMIKICNDIWKVDKENNKKENLYINQASYHSPFKYWNAFFDNGITLPTYENTIKVLNYTSKSRTDILIFPEQGVNINDLPMLCNFSRRNDTVIIGGLDYIMIGNYVINMTFTIIPYEIGTGVNRFKDCKILLSPKRYPAPAEYELFHHSVSVNENHRQIYMPVNKETSEGIHFNKDGITHSVLNCYEATDIGLRYGLSKIKPEVVHLVTNNKDVEYYDKIGEVLGRDIMCVSTITNYSLFGGTLIFSPYKEKFKRFISNHKGSELLHVYSSKIDVHGIKMKRVNNSISEFKQNPPMYYYRNTGEHSNE